MKTVSYQIVEETWSRYQMCVCMAMDLCSDEVFICSSLVCWLCKNKVLTLCHRPLHPDQIWINKNFALDSDPATRGCEEQRRSIHLTNSPIRSEWISLRRRRQEKSIPLSLFFIICKEIVKMRHWSVYDLFIRDMVYEVVTSRCLVMASKYYYKHIAYMHTDLSLNQPSCNHSKVYVGKYWSDLEVQYFIWRKISSTNLRNSIHRLSSA